MNLKSKISTILLIALIVLLAVAFPLISSGGNLTYHFDSRSLPENVIEYREIFADRIFRLSNDSVLKFAEIDREFSFDNLKVGDVIQIHFKDNFTVKHEGRIIEVMEKEPLSFRTIDIVQKRSNEGVDYPVTEKEYLGKIVQVFDDFESALKMEHGRAP